MWLKLLEISSIGGLIFLDSAPVGQWMFSQPVVCAPLLGWVMGDPMTGLLIGAFLQLFWAGQLPIGSSCPPETPICAMVATIVLIGSHKWLGIDINAFWITISISCGIGGGILGGVMTIYLREYFTQYANLADKYALNNQWTRISLIPLYTIAHVWFFSTVVIFISSALSLWLVSSIRIISFHNHLLNYIPWILMALSIAVILEMFQVNKRKKVLVCGLLVGLVIGALTGVFSK